MAWGWRRSKSGYWFRNTVRGKLLAQKNAALWVWDAIQDQPDMIVPDTHRKTGKTATLKEAKAAAEHALQYMISQNA